MVIPQETMTFKAMKNAIELGRVEKAVIFRDPKLKSYELDVTFRRSEPNFHLKSYTLLSQRGEVRRFKTADSAFKAANELNLCVVELVCDPCQEQRYESGAI